MGRTRIFEARVPRDLHLEPGDLVTLELEPDHLLQAAWVAYGLPLLGIILAVGAASVIVDGGNESLVIACGLLGLLSGLVAGRRVLRKDECLHNMTPVAAHRVQAPTPHG
jgi:positive regulator of sigma E activity